MVDFDISHGVCKGILDTFDSFDTVVLAILILVFGHFSAVLTKMSIILDISLKLEVLLGSIGILRGFTVVSTVVSLVVSLVVSQWSVIS